MSRCGGCDLCWPNGKENFGVSCQGDCEVEEYASNLNSLVSRLRSALESSREEESEQDKWDADPR